MEIKVLGTGCPNCKTLESNTRKAVEMLDISASVVKVEDMAQILSYQLLRMPGLVIDEKVVLYGRVPTVDELREIISSAR